MRQAPFANLDKKTFRQTIIELLEREYKQEVIEFPYVTEEDIELKRQNVSKTEHV